MAANLKHPLDADSQLEVRTIASWLTPKLIGFCAVASSMTLAFALVGLGSLFFTDPLPYVKAVTDSGVVADVFAK